MKLLKVNCILTLLLVRGSQAFAPLAKTVSLTTISTRLNTKLNAEYLEQKTPDEMETTELLDTYGEKARFYRRNVFTAADWIRSRRADRFITTILKTPNSALIRQLATELTFITFASLFIVAYNDILINGFEDFSRNKYDALAPNFVALQLPLAPFTLSSGALGLLLAFRTNVSYSRWNEARTAWGKVINDSRSITRMGCIWAKSYKGIDNTSVQRLTEAVCSFSRSLMNRTLPPQEDEDNFKKYTYERLSDQEYAEVLRYAKHRPTAALAEITSILVDFRLNPLHQVEVEKIVTGLCDALGASERIFTSPVPTFYTRLTARFLAFWLLILPLGLYEPMKDSWNHWAVIPVTIAIAGFLLGIEELATQMEEPFSILPMEKMCEGSIRTSVMEQMERSQNGVQARYYGEGKIAAPATNHFGRLSNEAAAASGADHNGISSAEQGPRRLTTIEQAALSTSAVPAVSAPSTGNYLSALGGSKPSISGEGLTSYLDVLSSTASSPSGDGLNNYLDALPATMTSYLDTMKEGAPVAVPPPAVLADPEEASLTPVLSPGIRGAIAIAGVGTIIVVIASVVGYVFDSTPITSIPTTATPAQTIITPTPKTVIPPQTTVTSIPTAVIPTPKTVSTTPTAVTQTPNTLTETPITVTPPRATVTQTPTVTPAPTAATPTPWTVSPTPTPSPTTTTSPRTTVTFITYD